MRARLLELGNVLLLGLHARHEHRVPEASLPQLLDFNVASVPEGGRRLNPLLRRGWRHERPELDYAAPLRREGGSAVPGSAARAGKLALSAPGRGWTGARLWPERADSLSSNETTRKNFLDAFSRFGGQTSSHSPLSAHRPENAWASPRARRAREGRRGARGSWVPGRPERRSHYRVAQTARYSRV